MASYHAIASVGYAPISEPAVILPEQIERREVLLARSMIAVTRLPQAMEDLDRPDLGLSREHGGEALPPRLDHARSPDAAFARLHSMPGHGSDHPPSPPDGAVHPRSFGPGKRYIYYRCRSRQDDRPCPNPCLPEAAFEEDFLADLRGLSLPTEAVAWISDNIRGQLDASICHHAAKHDALEKVLLEAAREAEMLLMLKLRYQVDDETYERRRLQILDRQAKLKIQLDEPVASPAELMAPVEEVFNFSASLPQAFVAGDVVRRRQLLHAVCANPTVRDRKALYKAKEPLSFFEGQALTRSWQTVVERLRTWIVERNFQIPVLSFGDEDTVSRRRRAA